VPGRIVTGATVDRLVDSLLSFSLCVIYVTTGDGGWRRWRLVSMAWASAWAGEEVGSDPKEGVASWSMLYALRDEVQARLLLETRRDETRREK
jgi:hypothetical protein